MTNTYDDAGRWTKVQDWNGNLTTIGYDVNSNLTKYTLPTATTVVDTSTYNAADQMDSTTAKAGTTTFYSASYTRDSNNQLTVDTSAPATQTKFRYSALNQLCYAGDPRTTGCSSPPAGAEPFAYDAADNLIKLNTTTQQFNAADQLCWTLGAASGNACTSPPAGAATFAYDSRGNRSSQTPSTGAATCDAYDQANRLLKVSTGTGSSCTSPTTLGTYTYNAAGLRMAKTVAGVTTTQTWDLAGGLPLLLEDKTSAATLDYVYGPGGVPLEQINGTTTLWYHHDQLGSTRAITNATGVTQATYQYDPYGTTVASTGSVTNPFLYAGQYKDTESQLYYLRARYYDPATAQFLSRDPMVAETRSPYGYVSGSPLNGGDPSGNRPADFYLLTISLGPFSFAFAVDSQGNSYLIGGGSLSGLPGSAQGWAGWINPGTALNGPAPTEDQVHRFLTGFSGSVQASFGGGVGLVWGNPLGTSPTDFALLIGVGTPQYSATADYGVAGSSPVCNDLFGGYKECQQQQQQATLSGYEAGRCSSSAIRQRFF